MGPRWLFASSSPCSVKPILATHCSCSYIRRSHHRRGSANWLNSPVASTLANIDRPPANKPKLSYVGSKISATQNWTLPQVYSCLDHTPSRANCHCAAAAADGMCADKASWQSSTDSKVTAPAVTKLDKAFEAEGCQFVWGMNDLTVSDLNALFQKVGFPLRDPNRLQLALDHSHSVLWIRSMKQSRWARQGQLLGFARATSDGALSATIWDVAVNPAWQRSGLGRGLVERLTARLVNEDITIVSLYAEPNVVGLYNRLGFVANPDGIKGMAFQKTSKPGKALVEQAAATAAVAA